MCLNMGTWGLHCRCTDCGLSGCVGPGVIRPWEELASLAKSGKLIRPQMLVGRLAANVCVHEPPFHLGHHVVVCVFWRFWVGAPRSKKKVDNVHVFHTFAARSARKTVQKSGASHKTHITYDGSLAFEWQTLVACETLGSA